MHETFRLLNPLRPVAAEEADTAARLGAWGAFVAAASVLVGAVMLYLDRERTAAEVRAVLLRQGADGRALEMVDFGAIIFPLWIAAAMMLVYLLFGLVQWHRRTRAIPLIMFLFSAYGLAMVLLGLFTPRHGDAMTLGATALTAFNWAMDILTMALLWAGYRGGSRLRKLRSETV